ncbi:MAG: HD domain-containing protein [Candidatus Binatia bacterium]
MFEFSDILYHKISLPEWLMPFIKLPEFLRLRGVRLSNVDSFEFKDFNGPTRWEHGIAVASLAQRCARQRGLSERDTVHLVLASLLHDVGTPPFAHTVEYVLDDFDHEAESQRLLGERSDELFHPERPIFASQLPQFRRMCEALGRELKLSLDPDEVARLIIGDGDLGPLVQGTVDLDNADNVTRACLYLGIDVDASVPIKIAEWLGEQEHLPPDLEEASNPWVVKWLEYRRKLYQAFFESSHEELGRQAYLQHLMRRALDEGLPRTSLIWNTDEGLLHAMESADGERPSMLRPSLRELIQRYRLIENPTKVAQIEIENEEVLRVLRHPRAAAWIERELTGPGFEAMAILIMRRHGGSESPTLFPPARGTLLVFKLGPSFKKEQLPLSWQSQLGFKGGRQKLTVSLSRAISSHLPLWTKERPWLKLTTTRRTSIRDNLDGIGDWSFRLSRNEGIHSYPSTFVYAIPANFILALGLKGELIVDPFGGTGQTAVETVKYGGRAVTGDVNTIACMVARAKLTYLPHNTRERLRSLFSDEIRSTPPDEPPCFELADKWFHPETMLELCSIRNFVQRQKDDATRNFLYACFSAVLTLCTGRRGEQHGYFADNCPLPTNKRQPDYQDSVELFLRKVKRNLSALERFYATLQRHEQDPATELGRASVVRADVMRANPADYGVEAGSVSAIITSPPYLCMSDYALGQRLSYQWLAQEAMEADFRGELGARRLRFSSESAIEQYFTGLKSFAKLARNMVHCEGFLATVLGAPVAKRFTSVDVFREFDEILKAEGFEHIWHRERPINWHRNHGYSRLNTERLMVHVAV